MPPKQQPPPEPEPAAAEPEPEPEEKQSGQKVAQPSSNNGMHVLHANGRVALHFGVLGKKGEEEDGFAYYTDGKIAAMVRCLR